MRRMSESTLRTVGFVVDSGIGTTEFRLEGKGKRQEQKARGYG